jgi:hypothetical protein
VRENGKWKNKKWKIEKGDGLSALRLGEMGDRWL